MGDARDYFMYAFNLRHKQTYSRDTYSLSDLQAPVTPDALRAPGYPLFLSLFVDGPPNNGMIANIVFAQMLLSCFILVPAFCLYRCFLSDFWAAAALLLTALSPHLIVANSYLLTETLFCFILIYAAWLVSLFFIRPSLTRAVISGLALGAAILIKPGLQYFPLVLAVVVVVHCGRRKGIHLAAAMLIGCLTILSPWFLRNLNLNDSISDDTLKINFLHHGMYPEFKYNGLDNTHGFPYRYDPRSDEISQNTDTVLNEIVRRFRHEPGQHSKWYFIRKPAVFWSWNVIQGFGDVFIYPIYQTPYQSHFFFRWTLRLMRCFHWLLVLLCAAGSLMVWLPRFKYIYPDESLCVARFVSALLLYFTAIHIIGAPFPRYSIPLRPFLYGMAIFGLHMFCTSVKARKENS
jgi:hypothetical protein